MRSLSLSAGLIFAALASGQSAPNAVRVTKYILGVADLDRSYAFYHALGLDLENAAALNKPNTLPEMLLKLVDVPAGTKFRNMMLKVPNAPFALEVTEFTGMELHAVKPRLQDPGASVFVLAVGDMDAALAAAKKAGGEAVTTSTSRPFVLRDPDGYYVELTQSKTIGASFSFVVQDSEKAAAFYQDRFGFEVKSSGWISDGNQAMGTPDAQVRTASVTLPNSNLSWAFLESRGLNRTAYTARIPDPGAAGLGLQVRDIEAAAATMKSAGGASITQGGSVRLGSGKVGFVRDPNGVLVELAQP